MFRHFVNVFLFHFPPSRLFFLRNFLLRLANINLSKNVAFCGRGWVYGRGSLLIGRNTWISSAVEFYTHEDAFIEIGENCDIGPRVAFIIGSHAVGDVDRRAGVGMANSIVVGDGTWIGAGATILDGVTIGKGCIVAAGAVVRNDIEDNCLAAGVPALVKKRLASK